MDNRVYYGQYSLKHWLDLILKKNIILPDYQRYFVWNETKVKTLIETFKRKQFVPPITIGAFKQDDNITQNLILDGQQRLTSILLAHLGLYPDQATFKSTLDRLASENDDNNIDDDEDKLDNILEWDFKKLTEKGKNKEEILNKIKQGNYKEIDLNIHDYFLTKTFLGFSYLVPDTHNQEEQQKYYSSVFRNINVQGEILLPQESRASLYFLNKNLIQFFDPEFSKHISIKNFNNETKADFVRFLALLSHYARDGNSNKVARGYKPKMEKYYEEYIYSVVGENLISPFKDFSTIFPDGNYKPRFEKLDQTINDLGIPKSFTSIIEMDTFLFGLIYAIIFEGKTIDATKNQELHSALENKITEFKAEESHKRAPGALKYLRARIDSSIALYNTYANE